MITLSQRFYRKQQLYNHVQCSVCFISSETMIISAWVCATSWMPVWVLPFWPDGQSCNHQRWTSHTSLYGYQVFQVRGGRILAPGDSAGCLYPINISRLIPWLAAAGRIWQRSSVSVSPCLKTALCWRWQQNSFPLDFLISEALSGKQFNYDWYGCMCLRKFVCLENISVTVSALLPVCGG